MVDASEPVLADAKPCVCCGQTARTRHAHPLCDACVAPGEIRSYCARCKARGAYPPEDFIRVMSSHYPQVEFAPGMAVRLPACAACTSDKRLPAAKGEVRFYGISFD